MDPQTRKEAILVAARDVANKVGVARVRLADVARAAGITVPALYRYFRSKDELLTAALQRPVSARQDTTGARRDELMESALRLFARKGFRATTMAEIGEGVQVSQAALYRYFNSKEQLLISILRERLSPMSVIDQSQGRPPAHDLGAELQRLGQAMATGFHQNRNLWRFIFTEGINNEEAADLIYTQLFASTSHQLAEVLQRQIQAGSMRPMDPVLAADAFLGVLLMYLVVHYFYGERLSTFTYSDEQVIQGMTDLLLNGLRPR